jgi:hypothetical protein
VRVGLVFYAVLVLCCGWDGKYFICWAVLAGSLSIACLPTTIDASDMNEIDLLGLESSLEGIV